jgi:hypothetical protein
MTQTGDAETPRQVGKFHDSTVVGNTYLAVPTPGTHLRFRIDFTRTIYAETYGGLRLAVVHPDRARSMRSASASWTTAPSTAAMWQVTGP